MTLFRRRHSGKTPQDRGLDSTPVAGNDKRTLLALYGRVTAIQTTELPEDVAAFLGVGSAWTACGSRGSSVPIREEAEAVPDQAAKRLYSVARLGYLTRIAEYDLCDDARTEADFIDVLRPVVAEHRYGESVLENAMPTCAALASQEPWDPDPDDLRSSLGGVPGVGSKVRCAACAILVDSVGPSEGDGAPSVPQGTTADELRRAWLYGFYLRCAVEADEHGAFG
jgi:hypothetical protein